MSAQRCAWCTQDPLYIQYHDHEWGHPLHDEAQLFEMLCLEGQQAGLSWITVLKKRQAYRQHFFQHGIASIANMSDTQLGEIVKDPNVIRHLGKLQAIRSNAIAWQNLKLAGIDPAAWLWSFSVQPTLCNDVPSYYQAPAQTTESRAMSKSLKKLGFKFVGPTICYAFMQAVGMVNDHENSCDFKYQTLSEKEL